MHVCEDCAAILFADPVRVESACDALQLPVPESDVDNVDFEPLLPVYAIGEYAGPLRGLILDFKNCGHFALAPLLAERMRVAIRHLPCQALHAHVIVPAPSTMRAVRARGEDHMRLLARELVDGSSEKDGLRLAPRLRLEGVTQHSRNRRDRGRREQRRIRAANPRKWDALRGVHAIIVDDVVTTGSTMRTLHHCVRSYGLEPCAAVAIAAAQLPRQSRI